MSRPFKRVGKYNARRTGEYASKREAEFARQLGLRKAATNGDVLDWVEQVSIKLPGGVRYVVDFLVFHRDGTWSMTEVKGVMTDVYKLKMRLLAEARPEIYQKIEVVR
jgi:hypothetical protein